MKIVRHTSSRRGNPLWLPSPRVLANAGIHPHPTQPTPISPVADVHGATPLVLADAGTHPHPTQPTPISPVADVHGTTPLVLADAGTHPHPSQPTPISPVADVHGATPLVLADAGTHPINPRPSLPWHTYTAPPLLSSRMRGLPTQLNPRPSSRGITYTAPPLLSSRMRGPIPGPNSTHAHLSCGRRTRRHPSCPRECGDPSPPLNPRPSLPWQTYTAPPLLSSRMRGPIPALTVAARKPPFPTTVIPAKAGIHPRTQRLNDSTKHLLP